MTLCLHNLDVHLPTTQPDMHDKWLQVREGVYCRTMAVGRSPIRKVTWHAWHHIQAVLLWLFLEFVSWREWYHLRHWLSVTHDSIGKQT